MALAIFLMVWIYVEKPLEVSSGFFVGAGLVPAHFFGGRHAHKKKSREIGRTQGPPQRIKNQNHVLLYRHSQHAA